MKLTIKEFADKFGVTYVQASGAIGFFLSVGIIKKTEETLKDPRKKGKPSVKFSFPCAKTFIFDEQAYLREKQFKQEQGKAKKK